MIKIYHNHDEDNNNTVINWGWGELVHFPGDDIEFSNSLSTRFTELSVSFPARKYWANWTNVFTIHIDVAHMPKGVGDHSDYGFTIEVTVLDLTVRFQVTNENTVFPFMEKCFIGEVN